MVARHALSGDKRRSEEPSVAQSQRSKQRLRRCRRRIEGSSDAALPDASPSAVDVNLVAAPNFQPVAAAPSYEVSREESTRPLTSASFLGTALRGNAEPSRTAAPPSWFVSPSRPAAHRRHGVSMEDAAVGPDACGQLQLFQGAACEHLGGALDVLLRERLQQGAHPGRGAGQEEHS